MRVPRAERSPSSFGGKWRGGDVHMKKSGVLLVTLTGVNHKVWSHLEELSSSISSYFSQVQKYF